MSWVLAPTEERNRDTLDIDLRSTLDMLRLINDEDAKVPGAVREVLPALAAAVDLAVVALHGGPRIHYFGAGTSGRIAVLDAAELDPDLRHRPGRVVAHHAGGAAGDGASARERRGRRGERGRRRRRAAAGRRRGRADRERPDAVRRRGAARGPGAGRPTVLISANPARGFGAEVDVHVGVATGPEVIAGSTRMKAGTAQKLLLNAFSTALMVRMDAPTRT